MKALGEIADDYLKRPKEILEICINNEIPIFCNVEFHKPINLSTPWNKTNCQILTDEISEKIRLRPSLIKHIYPSDKLIELFLEKPNRTLSIEELSGLEYFAIKVDDNFIPCFVRAYSSTEEEECFANSRLSINDLYCLEEDIQKHENIFEGNLTYRLQKIEIPALEIEIQFNSKKNLILHNNKQYFLTHEISELLISILLSLYEEIPNQKGFPTHLFSKKSELFRKNGISHQIRRGLPRKELYGLIVLYEENDLTYISFASPVIQNSYYPPEGR